MQKTIHKTSALFIALALILGNFSNAQAAGSLITVSPLVDNTYLTNPGIGWQSDGNSMGVSETITYPYRPSITWSLLNPSDGTYNWSILDAKINEATAAGKQISFRVATMIGEGYGGHAVPSWVVTKGAVILSSGEPDYSNCIYQQEWGNFVNKLIQRYDGNPGIAFIDISGYGNFNEWSWQSQTEWDSVWDTAYSSGKANSSTMMTIDSQARRRLADIFIGGSFGTHQCKLGSTVNTVSYSYPGAQKTQLVMPNAGINQSTQYVLLKRPDVGFRYDCLGRANTYLSSTEVKNIWRKAPVVYEFCDSGSFNLALAQTDMKNTHGSVVHNNGTKLTTQDIQNFLLPAGYRYHLKQAQFNNQMQGAFSLSMRWQNLGYAPSYPKSGQNFKLHVYLIDAAGKTTTDYSIDSNVSKWMPAETGASVPENLVNVNLNLPTGIPSGQYTLKVSVIDQRTNKPIQLAFAGADSKGMYLLSTVQVISSNSSPTATLLPPTITPTSGVSPTAVQLTSTKTSTTVSSPTVTKTFAASPTALPVTATKTLTPVSSATAAVATYTKTSIPSATNTVAPGETTTTLQPDAAAGVDTFINDSANYGTSGYMGVGENNNQTNYYARSLIRFDLSSIPTNAIINSVTISLWTSQDLSSTDRNIKVYRLKKAFVESQATWNLSATGVNWQSAGASGANDHESTAIGSTLILADEVTNIEKQISITPAPVQEMISGAYINNGFIIIADAELNDRFNYKTSDSGTSMQRPKLVIRYTVATIAVQSLIGSLTPTPTNTALQVTVTNTPPATSTATVIFTPIEIIIPSDIPTLTATPLSPTTEVVIPTETETPIP